jgi:hypothetical protein
VALVRVPFYFRNVCPTVTDSPFVHYSTTNITTKICEKTTQPKGVTEERSLAVSKRAAMEVTRKFFGARCNAEESIAPPSSSVQAQTGRETSFSALEFLATAAANALVASI